MTLHALLGPRDKDNRLVLRFLKQQIIHPGPAPGEGEMHLPSLEAVPSQGSRFFIICHIHNHTSIISSEMQVELKKNTAFT